MMSSDPLSFMDISLDDDPAPASAPAPSSVPNATGASPSSAMPTTTTTTIKSPSTGNSNSNTTPRFLRWMIHQGLLENSPSTWQSAFTAMQSTYEQHILAHPYPQEEDQEKVHADLETKTSQQETSNDDLDPLTAMVQATESQERRLAEMDLQYRKERALRNRGKGAARMVPESEEYDQDLAALQVIDKDLARLANPHGNNNNKSSRDTKNTEAARKEHLRQVLFCYHCENNEPGYRQGMHEIASYLLYALELDSEQNGHNTSVNPIYQAALTYHLLTQVLRSMALAFDVQNGGGGAATGSSALQTIGRRVDHVVRTHDPLLGQRLAKLQVPPQMYFTKWIRLLFAREVPNVLEFWDEAFFGTTAATASRDFIPLLETFTVARLLVWSDHFMSIRDESLLLQTLMNLPVEPETHIWCQVARVLLNGKGAITIPVANREFRPPLATPATPAVAPVLPAVAKLPQQPQNNNIVAPLKSFLAEAGTGKHLGGWMEQLSSKTQILGERVKQEWSHIAAATNPEPQNILQQPTPRNEEGMGYNITYRTTRDEPPLYDPPVPAPAPEPPVPSPRPLTRNVICKRLDQSTATLHAYLMQQQSYSQVPSTVWQALADVQKLSRELRPRNNQS